MGILSHKHDRTSTEGQRAAKPEQPCCVQSAPQSAERAREFIKKHEQEFADHVGSPLPLAPIAALSEDAGATAIPAEFPVEAPIPWKTFVNDHKKG